ncbi:MAG: DUF6173 family protein [Paracoccaceae bacterium]
MENYIATTAEALEADAIRPRSRAVMVDPKAAPTVEQEPLPQPLCDESDDDTKSPAQWAYERVILYIQNFEKQLDADHEICMGFTGGDAGTMRIMGLGFFAPDIVTFYGVDGSGARVQMVQHYNQLNVMLRAVPKVADEPNRIGFQLARDLGAETPPPSGEA